MTVAEQCRVTVRLGSSKLDVSLPGDVPLAEMLPTLLRYAGGTSAIHTPIAGGWTLSRLGGEILDTSRTPTQAQLLDGETIYLAPRSAVPPRYAHDDVADAVAVAAAERGGTWTTGHSRRYAIALGMTALAGGIPVVGFSGATLLGAVAGFGLALILTAVAALLSRVLADSTLGAGCGLIAVGYAASGGLLLLAESPQHLSGVHSMLGAAAAVLFVVLAAAAVGDHGPLFVGAGVAAVLAEIAAVVAFGFGAKADAAAAVVAGIVILALPALPMTAYRLARLEVPRVPTGPADLRADCEDVDGDRVRRGADVADAYLAGLVGGVAVAACGALIAVVFGGGLSGVLLGAVLSLVLLSQSRAFPGWRHRVPLLVAGSLGLGLVTVAGFSAATIGGRLGGVLGGLLILAVIGLGRAVFAVDRVFSPLWGRAVDIAEIALVVGMLPLVLWTMGLCDWIRAIRG